MLGVSPSTLRSWERRFGYPEPRRSAGGHRQFDLAEIEALRAAFQETQNVSSAIAARARPRRRPGQPGAPARRAPALRRGRGRPRPRGEPRGALGRAHRRGGAARRGRGARRSDSAEAAFAWRWATGWLAAAQRVAPPATREEAVVVFDSSAPGDADGLHAQALELALRRRGLRTLTLGADARPRARWRARCTRSTRASSCSPAATRRSTRSPASSTAARRDGGPVAVFDFRGALPETGASTVERLAPQRRCAARRARSWPSLDGRDAGPSTAARCGPSNS